MIQVVKLDAWVRVDNHYCCQPGQFWDSEALEGVGVLRRKGSRWRCRRTDLLLGLCGEILCRNPGMEGPGMEEVLESPSHFPEGSLGLAAFLQL